MDVVLGVVAAGLILAGLAGAILPGVPGIPLVFGGLWLISGIDHYRHIGRGWLVAIACVGAVGLALDVCAAALGAKRLSASPAAIWGALFGTAVGVFLGLPGLLLGPFAGAMLGELSTGRSILRSAHVGLGTWLGLLAGTLVKLASSFTMVALFGAGWWWNR
jgi:uncharacterized protein YqgC (DUF456 family)